MLRVTPARRIGTLSTFLANGILYAAHIANVNSPFGVLVLGGVLVRGVLSLPWTIYGDQCLSRVAAALPELQDAHHEYLDIAEHPRAITWEKKVAAQKLKNDRDRIFRSYKTNNIKMTVPYVVGAAVSVYSLGIPAQQVGTFFTQQAHMVIQSPLAFAIFSNGSVSSAAATATATATTTTTASLLCTIDPTLSAAMLLTLANLFNHLKRREGFNDRLDEYIVLAKRYAVLGYGTAAVLALVSCSTAPALVGAAAAVAAPQFFPAYLAPFWLGMSATTAVKTLLVNCTPPGRALFRVEAYPPQHGTYGERSTAEGHEYRLAFTSVDAEEKRDMWQSQKRALDYECDIRLHRFFTHVGLFDDVEEMEYEAEKLKRKRVIARDRRRQRESQEVNSAAAPPSASASASSGSSSSSAVGGGVASDGIEPIIIEAGTGSEPSAKDFASKYMDTYNEEQQARRHNRQQERERDYELHRKPKE